MLGIRRNTVKLSPLQISDAWGRFTVKIWKEKLDKFHIGQSEDLENSLAHETIAQGDAVIKIVFDFKYYGKFVDMGVGRGTKVGNIKDNATSRRMGEKMLGHRKAKKWYSKTLFAETAKLGEIMAREYAHQGVIQVVENIGDNSIK